MITSTQHFFPILSIVPFLTYTISSSFHHFRGAIAKGKNVLGEFPISDFFLFTTHILYVLFTSPCVPFPSCAFSSSILYIYPWRNFQEQYNFENAYFRNISAIHHVHTVFPPRLFFIVSVPLIHSLPPSSPSRLLRAVEILNVSSCRQSDVEDPLVWIPGRLFFMWL